MTKPFLRHSILFALCCFACVVVGCDHRTPDEIASSRESVVNEVMGRTAEKPTASFPDLEVASEKNASVEPSVVKQQTSPVLQHADHNNKEAEKASLAISPSIPSDVKQAPKLTVDDPTKAWTHGIDLPRETWEVQYLGNNPVGFFHRKIEAISGGNVRHEAESRMRVSVKGDVFEQRVQLTTLERDNGEIVEIVGEMKIGPNEQKFKGRITNEVMTLIGEENGEPFSVSIPWEKRFRGPFAVEQSMFRNPLQPREIRKLKYFDPLIRKVVDGRLEASEFAYTPTLLGGSRELLEVRNIGIVGEGGSQALLWVDKKGEGFKSYISANDILSYRTEPISAQIIASTADLRNTEPFSIPLKGAVELLTQKSRTLNSISYEVKHSDDDPYRMFAVQTGKDIKSPNAFTAIVTVYRGGRELDLSQDADRLSAIDSGTLMSSAFIPSDTPRILETATKLLAMDKSISVETATGLQKAKACRRFIQMYFSLKDFDKQIGTFSNMRRFKRGNCLEHALFFAAYCRALKIPTRIALGVKFNRSTDFPAMNFHAWVEVRDGNRWIPLDSSEDLTIPGSTEEADTSIDRIKIKETNFNSPNPYLEILSVLGTLPKLEIQVIPAEKTQ